MAALANTLRAVARFTVAQLMVAVAVIAMTIASLRYSSELWASIMFTLCLAFLLFGVLGVLFGGGDDRAFWAGFVVFGGVYALLAFGPWCKTEVNPRLLTTKILVFLYPRCCEDEVHALFMRGTQVSKADVLHRSVVFSSDGDSVLPASEALVQAAFGLRVVWRPGWGAFQCSGHSSFAVALGIFGGALARLVRAKSQRRARAFASTEQP